MTGVGAPAGRGVRWEVVRFLLILVSGVVCMTFLQEPITRLARGVFPDAFRDAEELLQISRTSRPAPRIVWIRYDDDSLAMYRDSVQVPRVAIAEALDWVRGAVADRRAAGPLKPSQADSARPKLVYIDVAIGRPSDDPRDDERLVRSLTDWSRDASASPLGVLAGSACGPPLRESLTTGADDATSQRAPVLRPGRYVHAVARASRVPSTVPVWTCPAYRGFEQAYWSCAYAEGGGSMKFAIPSPAWFALSVEKAEKTSKDTLGPMLDRASALCNKAEPDRGDRTSSSGPVSFSPIWAAGHYVGGTPVLTTIPISNLKGGNYDRSVLNDAIVVIGASNRLQPDLHVTDHGVIAGSALVGGAMRDVWVVDGLDVLVASWKTAIWTAAFFAGLAAVVRLGLPAFKTLKVKNRYLKMLRFLLSRDQLVMFALLLLVVRITSAAGRPDVISAGIFAVMLTELLLLTNAIEKEWHHENP